MSGIFIHVELMGFRLTFATTGHCSCIDNAIVIFNIKLFSCFSEQTTICFELRSLDCNLKWNIKNGGSNNDEKDDANKMTPPRFVRIKNLRINSQIVYQATEK